MESCRSENAVKYTKWPATDAVLRNRGPDQQGGNGKEKDGLKSTK